MARCFCRWRNVFICVCTPCICLGLMFVYVCVMVCMTMNSDVQHGTPVQTSPNPHFVAPGTFDNNSFASTPKTFWRIREAAFWNQLQMPIDRLFNPIILSRNKKPKPDGVRLYESLLNQSLSRVEEPDRKEMPRQLQTFVEHMGKRDYPVLIQPRSGCGAGAADEKEPPLLLLAVKTTELNFKNRRAIRETWGRAEWVAGRRANGSAGGRDEGGYVRRVFLLGKEDPEDLGLDLSPTLKAESETYGDILRWDFRDTFFNLTLKDVLFWSWFTDNCKSTRFIFKGDDDVFVNTPNMVAYLRDRMRTARGDAAMDDFMVGDVIHSGVPDRAPKSKYFIPPSFYVGLYPSYAGGGGVLYSGRLTRRLRRVSKRLHLFPIDDVFVGMCMARLESLPVHNPAFLTFDFPEEEEMSSCAYHTVIMVHRRTPEQVAQLWAEIQNPACWGVPLRREKTEEGKPTDGHE